MPTDRNSILRSAIVEGALNIALSPERSVQRFLYHLREGGLWITGFSPHTKETARQLAAKLIPHTTSMHNVDLIETTIADAVAAERARCADIARSLKPNCGGSPAAGRATIGYLIAHAILADYEE